MPKRREGLAPVMQPTATAPQRSLKNHPVIPVKAESPFLKDTAFAINRDSCFRGNDPVVEGKARAGRRPLHRLTAVPSPAARERMSAAVLASSPNKLTPLSAAASYSLHLPWCEPLTRRWGKGFGQQMGRRLLGRGEMKRGLPGDVCFRSPHSLGRVVRRAAAATAASGTSHGRQRLRSKLFAWRPTRHRAHFVLARPKDRSCRRDEVSLSADYPR